MTTLMYLFIVTVASSQHIPSDGSLPFAVSVVIGDTLDATERRFYHFLPHYQGFKWATFHKTPTDTLAVTVAYEVQGLMHLDSIPRYLKTETILQQILGVIATTLEADAKRIRGTFAEFVFRDDRRKEGEILFLRDSALIIGSDENLFEDIQLIRANDLKQVVFDGGSYLWFGFAAGVAAGTIAAGAFAVSAEEENNGSEKGKMVYAIGPIAGGIGGLLIAAIVDEVAGDSVVVINGTDISVLKPFARYNKEEPVFLRAVK